MELKLSKIQEFFNQKEIAIAGVSRDEKKFGSTLYTQMQNKKFNVLPLNPNIEIYKEKKCYRSIYELPQTTTAIIICTKPQETEKILEQAKKKGIKHIWIQQGAQIQNIEEYAQKSEENIIYGKCAFMFLEPVDSVHKFHRFFVKLFGGYPK